MIRLMASPLNVLGTHEVAQLLGVHRVTVSKWRAAGHMPEPDALLAAGPVWRLSTIARWAKRTGRKQEGATHVRDIGHG